jgi:hypothetical protein
MQNYLVVLFWLIVGSVAAYILYRWRTNTTPKGQWTEYPTVLELNVEGERVIMKELMHGATHDVIKVNTHAQRPGVAAEYEWMRRRYRGASRSSNRSGRSTWQKAANAWCSLTWCSFSKETERLGNCTSIFRRFSGLDIRRRRWPPIRLSSSRYATFMRV